MTSKERPMYTISKFVWSTDDLGLYWTADLFKDGKKTGVTGNYYDVEERQLSKHEQMALSGFDDSGNEE